jgi:hypothetical protein
VSNLLSQSPFFAFIHHCCYRRVVNPVLRLISNRVCNNFHFYHIPLFYSRLLERFWIDFRLKVTLLVSSNFESHPSNEEKGKKLWKYLTLTERLKTRSCFIETDFSQFLCRRWWSSEPSSQGSLSHLRKTNKNTIWIFGTLFQKFLDILYKNLKWVDLRFRDIKRCGTLRIS